MDRALADWITQAIELMMRCNSFEYDGQLYCYATGTSIGAHFVCSYSGFAMAKVEQEGLRNRADRERWNGGLFQEFLATMNSVDPSIKFTSAILLCSASTS